MGTRLGAVDGTSPWLIRRPIQDGGPAWEIQMNGRKPCEAHSGSVWHLASMGSELAAAVLGGCALGWWIDQAVGHGHWGLIVGALVGIIGGLYNLIRKAVHESLGLTRPQNRDTSDRNNDHTPSPT